MNLEEAKEALETWEIYDFSRGAYEYLIDVWIDAQTTSAANSILQDARKARDAYELALSELRELGYDPSGPDPVSSDLFKEE